MASLLIVDDDERIREALCELFSEEHQCDEEGTAEGALARMQERDYDVMITDISMPGMSGEDLLGFVKIYKPRTPVVFITGGASQSDAERLAFDYLLKPFRLSVIARTVARAIECRR
ncbi:MAG: response regulator [Acidobacteriota bacterium]|nr:response regulator [Acidobacteriota bacterium]